MILLDTSGLISALFPDQHLHQESVDVLSGASVPLLLSPFVLAEADYLIGKLAGIELETRFLEEVERGAYRLVPFGAADVGRALGVIRQYSNLAIGLTDASLVVLAHQRGIQEILTLDQRHFRTLPGPLGKPFRLLPLDS